MSELDDIRGVENNDDESVYYCKRCLSLNIKYLSELASNAGSDNTFSEFEDLYCDNCYAAFGSIDKCSIEEWEDKYNKKYNKRFLDYGRRSKKQGDGRGLR